METNRNLEFLRVEFFFFFAGQRMIIGSIFFAKEQREGLTDVLSVLPTNDRE